MFADKNEALKLYRYGIELALEQLGRAHPLTREHALTHKKAMNFVEEAPSESYTPSTRRSPQKIIPSRKFAFKESEYLSPIKEPRKIRRSERPRVRVNKHRRFLTGDRLNPMFVFKKDIKMFPKAPKKKSPKKDDMGRMVSLIGDKVDQLEAKMDEFRTIISPIKQEGKIQEELTDMLSLIHI